jgi:hypothetical protein
VVVEDGKPYTHNVGLRLQCRKRACFHDEQVGDSVTVTCDTGARQHMVASRTAEEEFEYTVQSKVLTYTAICETRSHQVQPTCASHVADEWRPYAGELTPRFRF